MKNPDSWWSGKRVLVTGAAGFLGRWIRERLDSEAIFIGTDVVQPEAQGYDYHGLNVLKTGMCIERVLLHRPDVIIHLAGLSHINESQEFPLTAFELNVIGTLNIMRAANILKKERLYPPHVVVASSNHVYGNHPGMSPRTEDAPLNQLDIYGASKHCQDVLARSLGMALHVPTVALRHVNAYGPWNPHKSHITNAAILAAIKGEPLRLRGDGSARKDYLFAADVADAYLMLAKHASDLNVIGRAFNCSPRALYTGGEPPSVLEWVMAINVIAAEKGLTPQVPTCLPAGQGEQSGYYESLDSSALRKWTGWWQRTDFKVGIAQTIDYWLARA